MTLSPFEAEHREFGTSPIGYRKRDVNQFVDEVQKSLQELWESRSNDREENERLKERLAQFEQLENQLKNTLLLAQDSTEKAYSQARRESDLMLKEAGQKSREIIHTAHEEKQRLEMILHDLYSAEQEARHRLRTLSRSILEHLDETKRTVETGKNDLEPNKNTENKINAAQESISISEQQIAKTSARLDNVESSELFEAPPTFDPKSVAKR